MRVFARKYPRTAAGLVLLAAFVAGASSALIYSRQQSRLIPGTMVTVEMRRQLPEELRRLDLSAEQRARVLAVLDSTREKTVILLRAFQPRLQQLLDSADTRVQALLTADQRTRLAADRSRRPRMLLKRETSVNGRRSTTVDTTPP